MLRLRNTLTRTKEEFKPLDAAQVRMYVCGPTVYDYGHIGNFRTFVAVDILRRYLLYLGYTLLHVMNITDIDDKIIRGMGRAGKGLREFTDYYTKEFLQDVDRLAIQRPEKMPRATDHIPEMVEIMEKLRQRGHTYDSDGSLYFSIATLPAYGKLSGLKLEGNDPESRTASRVDVDEYEKDDARDFVLWKAPKEEDEPRWETPFGVGRPGWHLECSAMSMKYLGESFDIHCGGVDLIFPHHENEIAQSEGATGKPFVKLWFHVEFLLVEGEKMAKSKGNFYTVRDLIERGFAADAIRYLLLSVPYSTQLNFTLDGLRGAESAIEKLRNFRHRVGNYDGAEGATARAQAIIERARSGFEAAMNDDLNTAVALAALHDLRRDINIAMDENEFGVGDKADVLRLLERFDCVLGILGQAQDEALGAEVEALIAERNEARKNRDFARADQIRDELASRGILLEDTPQGTKGKKR